MPMTKAERAQMEALEVRAALTWQGPPPAPIDLAVWRAANPGVEVFEGWTYNAHSERVSRGWSKGAVHSSGGSFAHYEQNRSRYSATQTAGGPWFHAEADAFRAMRHEVALQCAQKLAALDARLAELTTSEPKKD